VYSVHRPIIVGSGLVSEFRWFCFRTVDEHYTLLPWWKSVTKRVQLVLYVCTSTIQFGEPLCYHISVMHVQGWFYMLVYYPIPDTWVTVVVICTHTHIGPGREALGEWTTVLDWGVRRFYMLVYYLLRFLTPKCQWTSYVHIHTLAQGGGGGGGVWGGGAAELVHIDNRDPIIINVRTCHLKHTIP
jgi:hypothetical protein